MCGDNDDRNNSLNVDWSACVCICWNVRMSQLKGGMVVLALRR